MLENEGMHHILEAERVRLVFASAAAVKLTHCFLSQKVLARSGQPPTKPTDYYKCLLDIPSGNFVFRIRNSNTR